MKGNEMLDSLIDKLHRQYRADNLLNVVNEMGK